MGLAGQKVKQRIGADPNNLHWSNDQSKFGFRMLQKMGWAPGKGLGANEDGSKDHVKIKLKDDTLGLGAKKTSGDNWLGNTDAFSQLLASLNSQTDSTEAAESEGSTEKKKRKSGDSEEEEEGLKKKSKKEKKEKKEKKTKKEKKEKKVKKEKKEKEKKSKKQGSDDNDSDSESNETQKAATVLRNAARAKFLKAKRMATQHDKARLNEILGIRTTPQPV